MNEGKKEIMTSNADLWLGVKRDIENKIIAGEFTSGDKLPTIAEFGEFYGVGRSTIQKVIKALSDEGVIMTRIALGCYVVPYVKEKLLERRKNEFAETVCDMAKEAAVLGVQKQDIMNILEELE